MASSRRTTPSSADRALFLVAALFNILVAAALTLPGGVAWRLVGMSPPEQTLFLHLFAVFVAIFGLAYLWIGLEISGKRPLILIAVVGKLSVFAVVLGHYLAGTVPGSLPSLASGDFLFAGLFLRALYRDESEM